MDCGKVGTAGFTVFLSNCWCLTLLFGKVIYCTLEDVLGDISVKRAKTEMFFILFPNCSSTGVGCRFQDVDAAAYPGLDGAGPDPGLELVEHAGDLLQLCLAQRPPFLCLAAHL